MAGTNTAVATGKVSSGILTTGGGSNVDTVTFADDIDTVEVLGYDGVDWLWFSVDGSTPTVGGQNCYPIPPSVGSSLFVTVPTAGGTVVKVISTNAAKYVVVKALP